MSHIVRSAKPGSEWTCSELDAYNVVIQNHNPRSFFGQGLPENVGGVDPDFLNCDHAIEATDDNTHRLLMYLNIASEPDLNQASAIVDFSRELLRVLGFEKRHNVLRSGYAIPLLVCGNHTAAWTDIRLIENSTTILLVMQEDKTVLCARDREAQLIAAAVAAFQTNNRNRAYVGLEKIDRMSIPAITMSGTRPIFYVIPVTKELSTAVQRGDYPEQSTVVKKCVVVGENLRLPSEGMEKPAFRLEALKYFSLFRLLAESLWSEFIPRR